MAFDCSFHSGILSSIKCNLWRTGDWYRWPPVGRGMFGSPGTVWRQSINIICPFRWAWSTGIMTCGSACNDCRVATQFSFGSAPRSRPSTQRFAGNESNDLDCTRIGPSTYIRCRRIVFISRWYSLAFEEEKVANLLEQPLRDAVHQRRIFIVDLKILEDLPCAERRRVRSGCKACTSRFNTRKYRP